MDVAKEESYDHYPIWYLLIMKYINANLIFASDSGFIWFYCIYKQCTSRTWKRHARSERFDMIF